MWTCEHKVPILEELAEKDNDLVLKTVATLNCLTSYIRENTDLDVTPKDIYFAAGQRRVRFLNYLKERADKEAIL